MRFLSLLSGFALLNTASAGVFTKSYEQLPTSALPLHKSVLPSNDLPVGGDVWPVAIFWMEIQIGTPPRTFPVAIDTGSYTLDIPSSTCSQCIHTQPNNAYDSSSSSTFTPMFCGTDNLNCAFTCDTSRDQCTFSNSYQTCDLSNPTASCTIAGDMVSDNVYVAGLGPVNITFGVITSQTSNFDQFKNIDGVMGLAGPAGNQNVFSQLVADGYVKDNVFAMCFNEGAISNGTITIGGVDPNLYHGEIAYTPNMGGIGYSMNLLSLSINGESVDGAATNQGILDSGTNVLLLPQTPYEDLKSKMLASCGTTSLHGICDVSSDATLFDGVCFDMTSQQIDAFPELEFAFSGNLTLTMSGRDYLNLNDPLDPTQYCLGIRNTGQSFLIFGDTLMHNYYTVFDLTRNQIGWAPVNTKTCGSQPLKNYKYDDEHQVAES